MGNENKKDISTEKGTERSVGKFFNNKKRLLLRLFCMAMVSATAVSVSVAATGCGGKGNNSSSSVSESVEDTSEGETGGEAGEYYFDLDANDGVAESVLTFTENTFELVLNGVEKSGSYQVQEGKYMLTFSDSTETATVTLAENALTLEYNGNTYTFLKKVNFTVTYETNGGSAVAAATVMNGKMAQKPADPTKNNCFFIAWYKDAAFTEAYAFDATPVTGDITLYARFEEVNADATEFQVEFVVDGEVTVTQTTQNGGLYNLPVPEKEGATFAGWWVSQFNAADKLSYQYEEGQVLQENTKLYAVWESNAPVVSVNATGIAWKISGNVAQYSIKITAPDGTVTQDTSAVNKYAYDFSSQAAGCYVVEVSANGQTATAYYNNKALARVSLFKVENSVLVFNGVANAEKYLITVVCGNEEHVHTELDNGNSTNYNFANCTMVPGGIQFTVQAMAEGYVTSVSETFVYAKDLDAVSGLAVDAATDAVTWNAVANATAYVVEVKQGDAVVAKATVAETSFNLKEFSGDMQISVYPVAKNYNSPEAATVSYTKANLAAPANVKFDGTKLVWDAVEGATGYTVKVGEKTYTTTAAELAVSMDMYVQGQDAYEVTVQATSDTKGASALSDAITVNFEKMNATLTYDKGTVIWAAVVMASRYTVAVNDGEEVTVNVGTNSYEVTLTQAGENTITVRCYDLNGGVTSASIKVNAYEISFDTCGGSTVAPIYKAVGDKLNLPTAEMEGYEFDAWYNVAGGPANNGAKFTDEYFTTASDMLLYANWKSNTYTVTFDVGMYGEIEEESAEVVFNHDFKLPVATSQDTSKVFGGWFESANGQGIQYTDEKGNSVRPWYDAKDMTLHASWVNVLEYTLIDGGEAYAVSQGRGIGQVSHVKVPETYNGKPVKMIEADAFKNCKTLTSIEIPDTISSIVLGTGGYTATGSAFYGCTNLKSIEVYCVNGDHEANPHVTYYESIDGALIFNDPNNTEVKELIYVPGEKTGSYTIPTGVTHIGSNVFKSSKLKEVTIPATVKYIGEKAFYSSDILTFNFAATPEGEGEVSLTIGDQAFYMCDMTEITLPSRLSEFSVKAFASCNFIEKVYIDGEGGKYTSTADGMLCEAVLDDSGAPTANKKIVYCPIARKGSYTIPVGVTEIGDSAFENCDDLTELIVPGYVTKIGTKAFYGCGALVNVEFSNDLANLVIGEQAFYNCTAIQEVYIPAGVTEIGLKAFSGCSNISSLTFSADATAVIGEQAFYNLDNITELEIPAGITMIGKGAFKSCGGIVMLNFRGRAGDPGLTISDEAFMSCLGLTELILPENLVLLGANAFGSISNLKTVYAYVGADAVLENFAFGDSKAATAKFYIETLHIGKDAPIMEIPAIFGVDKLANIIVDPLNENYSSEDGVLFDKEKTMIVYYPAAKEGEYRIPDTIEKIGSRVFDTKTGLTKIIIGANVTEIGDFAFTDCKNLVEVYFEATPDTQDKVDLAIGVNAFQNCKALTTINLPVRTKTIGTYAFSGCVALPSITIPEGVTALEDKTFQDCDLLTTINIPASVTSLGTVNSLSGAMVFYGCDGLTEVIVDEANEYFMSIDGILYAKKATEAEDGTVTRENVPAVLMYVPTLKAGKVTVPATVTEVWSAAFRDKCEITEIEFLDHTDDTTLKLGEYTFYASTSSKTKLEKVILPEGLKNIPGYTFYYLASLKEIVIPNTVTTIQPKAFYTLRGLEKLTFEEGGTEALRIEDGQVSSSSYGAYYYGVFNMILSNELTELVLPERTSYIGTHAFRYSTASGGYSMDSWVSKKLTSLVIPKGVMEIGDYAFAYEKTLVNITFAEGNQLTVLNKDVFYQSGVKSMTLPETLEEMGSYVFGYTTALEEITIPASVKKIDTYAFTSSALKKITFAEGSQLQTIGNNAFYNCKALTEITIPATVTTIGDSAFSGCKLLTAVEIPASVESIGATAFSGCTALKNVTFAEGCILETIGNSAFANTGLERFDFPVSTENLTLGTTLFSGCKQLTTVYLSKSVVNIDNVLSKCSSLKTVLIAEDNVNFKTAENLPLINNYEGTAILLSVGELKDDTFIVPEGVNTIGELAFEGQPFKKIVLPASLMFIETKAFWNCQQLEEIVFAEGCRLESIGNYAFEYCQSLKSIVIPETVTSIGQYAFHGCKSMTSVTLPSNIETLGNYAFANTMSLESIELPASLTSTGTYTFAGSGLKSVKFNEGIEFIGASPSSPKLGNSSHVFMGCESLTEVILPSTLKGFGMYTFGYCHALQEVTLPESCTIIGTYSFRKSGLTSIKLPEGVTEIGTYTFEDCTALATIELPSSVTKVGSYAFENTAIKSMDLSNVTTLATYLFQNCIYLEEVTLNSNLTQLQNYMFDGCTSLKSIDIPAGVKYLGTYTFRGCSSLTEVTLPSVMTVIGTSATAATNSKEAYTFENCTSLKTINLENITKMSKGIFKGCTSLTEVNLAKLTQLGYENFMGCTSLKSVVLPKVTSLGANAFDGCTALTSIEFKLKVTTVGKQALANCTSLTTVLFNSTQANVGTFLFENCTSLKEAIIPASVTSIGQATFSGCTALTSVTFATGSKVTTINKEAFMGCTSLKDITLPTTVTTISENTFDGCTSLTSLTLPASVTTIKDYAFANSGLTTLHIPAKAKTINGLSFAGNDKFISLTWDTTNTNFKFGADGAVYSADGATLVYYPTQGESTVVDLRESGVTSIGKYAFASAYNVTEIYLPEAMTEIGTYAFAYAPSLETVHIPETVTSIGTNAFLGCTSLGDVVIPEGITEIASYTFKDAVMNSITLPSTLETIGTYAFRSAVVETIEIPASVYSIGNYAFQESGVVNFTWAASTNEENAPTLGTNVFLDSVSVKNVVLPEGLLKLQTNAFKGCTALENIQLPSTLTEIAGNVFENCASLQYIQLPEGFQQITTTKAFMNSGLKEIVFPDGATMTQLYASTFEGCTALERVVLPESGTLVTIAGSAFLGCTALKEVNIPESVTAIYTKAFMDCTSISSITIPENASNMQDLAFSGWTAEQTIYIQTARIEVNKTWTNTMTSSPTTNDSPTTVKAWNNGCEAKIVFI